VLILFGVIVSALEVGIQGRHGLCAELVCMGR